MSNNLVQDLAALKKLPNSWIVLPFQKVIEDSSSGNKKTLKSDFLDKGKYVIIDQGQETIAGYTNNQDILVKSPPPYIIFGDHTRIFKYIEVPFAMGADGTKVLKAKDNTALDEKYLYYFFLTLNIPNTGYNRHYKYLKNTKIPLPPLAEQQKIASILDAADSLRQKDQQLIKKYTALSQSLFLEMFGDPVINSMGWKMGPSIQHCKCIVPGRDKPKNFSGEIPWVTTNDLNRLNYTDKSKKDIGLTDEEIVEVRAKIIPVNSVILTCVGDLGVISINSSPVVINQQLHSFQCDYINISPIFMMYVLSYQTPYMYKMASSTTVPYMNKTVCNNIPMIYPPITLQNQFAERIKLIEVQKQQAQTSLQKSAALFNSLLQRAFKGELTV